MLTEFEVKAAPKAEPAKRQKLDLEKPVADFNQGNYDSARRSTATARRRTTAGRSPQTGQSHWATFEVKQPAGFDGGTILTFTLDQRYNDKKHLLGRFRVGGDHGRKSRSA